MHNWGHGEGGIGREGSIGECEEDMREIIVLNTRETLDKIGLKATQFSSDDLWKNTIILKNVYWMFSLVPGSMLETNETPIIKAVIIYRLHGIHKLCEALWSSCSSTPFSATKQTCKQTHWWAQNESCPHGSLNHLYAAVFLLPLVNHLVSPGSESKLVYLMVLPCAYASLSQEGFKGEGLWVDWHHLLWGGTPSLFDPQGAFLAHV